MSNDFWVHGPGCLDRVLSWRKNQYIESVYGWIFLEEGPRKRKGSRSVSFEA